MYRNFTRALGQGMFAGRELTLIQCTKKTVLDAHLATLKSADLIVVSVLENFIVNVCAGVTEEEVHLFGRQQITSVVEDLLHFAQRVPEVSIVIVPPMFRTTPPWFGSYLPDFIGFLSSEVARTESSCIAVSTPFVVTPSMLESDGVHLVPSGADRFLAHLDSELKSILVEVPDTSQPSDDRLDRILEVVNRNTAQLDTFQSISETVTELSRSTSEFEGFVRRRFKDDDLIFARMKEESDADINRSREDRVVITGLPGPTGPTSTHADKKRHYTEVVTRLVTLACVASEFQPKVVDVYINLRKDRGLPLVEARYQICTIDCSFLSRLFYCFIVL